MNKDKQELLKTLIEFYHHIMKEGHLFWHCQAQDETYKRPFYYVQIHRSVHMSTCGNCYTLMELKNRIRKVQKELGVEQWPLRYRDDGKPGSISVSDSSDFNPNYAWLSHDINK